MKKNSKFQKFESLKIQNVGSLLNIAGGATYRQTGSGSSSSGTTWDLRRDDGKDFCDVADGTTPR